MPFTRGPLRRRGGCRDCDERYTIFPAAVSTATEPLPALSIQMAGPTETPQGLINVELVTSAATDPGPPSEIMFVCTYVLLDCAEAPIWKMPGRADSARVRN